MTLTSHPEEYPATLKVMGVGGGGGNAIRHLLDTTDLPGVDFIAVNTDAQALEALPQGVALTIGRQLTRGRGAGAAAAIGRQAAEQSRETLRARLAGADMLFLMAGMGGGTGSGATPIIAGIAREMGLLTVAVVTRPFHIEGGRRRDTADAAIEALAEQVDCLVVVPNDRLLPTLGPSASMMRAFAAVNDVLRHAVAGIAEVITRPGMINIDFADVEAVMRHPGRARLGTGSAMGERRGRDAVMAALDHPLLEATDLIRAAGVLVSITAGPDLSLEEFSEIGELVASFASEEAMIVVGTSIDMAMSDQLHVCLVATGLEVSPVAKSRGDTDHADRPTPEAAGPVPGPRREHELLDINRFLNDLKR
jgi:cell division protein FtsZ